MAAEFCQKGSPRPSFKIKTTPSELRNIADQLDAMADSGSTLPGQALTVQFRNIVDLEWEPEISVERFARGTSLTKPIPVESIETRQ